ncbi:MAG TPA: hypothetical protein VGM02_04885 [Acidobacteriaceae bacterium]|jgi:hypothetical protein
MNAEEFTFADVVGGISRWAVKAECELRMRIVSFAGANLRSVQDGARFVVALRI